MTPPDTHCPPPPPSIFIRDCSGCTFYTVCRQLRLRTVTDSKFYIYSMAEVHIEFSNTISFAPFNGGYPEHAAHIKKANLNLEHNLWYVKPVHHPTILLFRLLRSLSC